MLGYAEIATQTELDALLERVGGFHDSMLKELHLANRAHVNPDHSMSMNHRFDARVLIQIQGRPYAIELLLIGIEALQTGEPGEYWDATGVVERWTVPVEKRRISLSFDCGLEITTERLFVRDRSDWLGPAKRLGHEVPDPDCVSATAITDLWRQCSACADAFEAELSEVYAICPSCERMTELSEGIDRQPKDSAPPVPGTP